MELIVLGSAGSIPTKERNLPSIALRYDGQIYLFDCGEGTQRQMMLFKIKYGKVKAIFITHLHLDHMLGVYGLLETFRLNNRQEELIIIGPNIKKVFNKKKFPFLKLIDIKKSGIVYKTDKFTVSAFKLYHNIDCFGYIFEEEKTLKFKQPLCEKLGVTGLMFKELMNKGWIKIGRKKVKLSDVTYLVPGRKIAYLGDTEYNRNIINKVKNVDLLIAESTYGDELKEMARCRKHLTAQQAAKIARMAKVKQLLLTHISQRYKDPSILLDEAQKIFKNTIIAQDGLVIRIPKHKT